jgi:dolichol-phosphate mannosyltransferase
MEHAVAQGYDVLVTMDADFSHHPRYLPELLALMERHEFVTGSRYVPGGGLGYGPLRRFVSVTANRLARLLLGIPLRECTTSYRGFRRELLVRVLDSRIGSTGYAFFFEMAALVCRLTPDVAEFPIYFADRAAGESKISRREISRGVTTLARLFARRVLARETSAYAAKTRRNGSAMSR